MEEDTAALCLLALQGGGKINFFRTEVAFIKKQQSTKQLTAKQRAFCAAFACTGDCVQAAKQAGYGKHPERRGAALLGNEAVREEIERVTRLQGKVFANMAQLGYRRLAFGGVADAVSLLYRDCPTAEELDRMDLFRVSEIRKPKDGMLEIKFFDRLKALEKLEQQQNGDGFGDLFQAIGEGAKAVSECE